MPTAASGSKTRSAATRPPAARAPRMTRTASKSRSEQIPTEELATQLATKLTIMDKKGKGKASTSGETSPSDELAPALEKLAVSKPKAKPKVSPLSLEDRRANAMRAVNAASRSLSGVIHSGWKAPQKGKMESSVAGYASAAKKGLDALRGLSPGEVDVERAASAVVGKLITLEMTAAPLLHDMRGALIALYYPAYAPSAPAEPSVLSLPLPLPEISIPEVVLTITATYLAYALQIHTRRASSLPSLPSALTSDPCVLAWAPRLSRLPEKQHDATFTRAYTALSACASSAPSFSPSQAYDVRTYATLCIACTRPGVIKPDTFWEQAVKFAMLLVSADREQRNQGGGQREVAQSVLCTFEKIVENASARPDRETFMSGKGFTAFCEFWISCAKEVGDVDALDRVNMLLGDPQTATKASGSSKPGNAALKGAKVYAMLAQALAVFENWDGHEDQRDSRITDARRAIAQVRPFLRTAAAEDDDEKRVLDKVSRALERLRRHLVKILDLSSAPKDVRIPARELLDDIVDVLEAAMSESKADLLNPLLDTLLTLSRSSLVVSNPLTYDSAYDHLCRASRLLSASLTRQEAHLAKQELANYTRCVAGTFHHLAGVLYQAGRYDYAVRFLLRDCELGTRALEIYRTSKGKTPERTGERGEAWKQLEEQLYRRWELLGVCQAKTGDRKLAYEGFVEAIKSFPFATDNFVRTTGTATPAELFATSALKQVATLIDRVTYLGACDLMLPVDRVSAKAWFSNFTLPSEATDGADRYAWASVVGAVIERQVDSLEGSKWKPAVRTALEALVKDAADVYGGDAMPIRKARVLLKALELQYYSPGGAANEAENLAEEIQSLLSQEDLGLDSVLAAFRQQYLASTHILLAMHARKTAKPGFVSVVVSNALAACDIVKTMLIASPRQSLAMRSSLGRRPSLVKSRSSSVAVAPRTKTSRIPAAPRKKPAARSAAAPTRSASRGKALKPVKEGVQAVPVSPTTPIARKVSLNAPLATPPKASARPAKVVPTGDDMPRFISQLRMLSHLTGLLGHVLLKVELLQSARKLCGQRGDALADDHIAISLDLAHEYAKLGKVTKAVKICGQVLAVWRTECTTPETRMTALLRYAESLAAGGNILKSATAYCEALELANNAFADDPGSSTAERVRARVRVLEQCATAATAFAVMQHSRDDPSSSLEGLLQSLRLWNRALDTLCRLQPPQEPKPPQESNPFEVPEPPKPVPEGQARPLDETIAVKQDHRPRPSMDVIEWRVVDGLMQTLFALVQGYLARGSPKEGEYFVQQAYNLASSLNAPAMVSRASARRAEILLHLGRLTEAQVSLSEAAESIANVSGPDAANVRRLLARYHELSANRDDSQSLYEQSIAMLDEMDKIFSAQDGVAFTPRRSLAMSPRQSGIGTSQDAFSPALVASILRHHISLLHESGSEYKELLDRLSALTPTAETQAERGALMAKLTLDDVYSRFRADIFLSSFAESAITIPMGNAAGRGIPMAPATQDIVSILATGEKMLWSDLGSIARRGSVPHVRSLAISLALIRTLQTSLRKGGSDAALLAASLIDSSTSITLHREMLEVIAHKFRDPLSFDDLRWPAVTPNGSLIPPPTAQPKQGHRMLSFSDSEDEDEPDGKEVMLRNYWKRLEEKYRCLTMDSASMSTVRTHLLPTNWVVVNISLTEDKSTIFLTRQSAGYDPLVFCLPLKGRRDSEEDEHLTFDDAVVELKEIIKLSDDGTRQAVNVKRDDPKERAAWWANRSALDKRLKELLSNLEFCWLGAFKTIFSTSSMPAESLTAFRTHVDKIFERSLVLKDAKRRRTRVQLDDALLECFASLSPSCRDEELEDIAYFVLDLYQFHGVPVAIAEIDIDALCVDLRAALEEHAARVRGTTPKGTNEHMFLVLDKNVQGFPWESIPALRGRSISRIPSTEFLLDRLELARLQRSGSIASDKGAVDRAIVDPRKTYFILNPSGDLKNTEARFAGWLKSMKPTGWTGVIGRVPSEQQFVDALERNDLVIYFGHGGAEQYVRSHKVRHLPRCAATMLWGCSSGALREMGDFDRVGTPYNYMLAGCPTLVANLWDVTDRDIDKFSQAVFDDLHLTEDGVKAWEPEGQGKETMSIITAVARARESCKLKYLTGAAPVVYGIPFYL